MRRVHPTRSRGCWRPTIWNRLININYQKTRLNLVFLCFYYCTHPPDLDHTTSIPVSDALPNRDLQVSVILPVSALAVISPPSRKVDTIDNSSSTRRQGRKAPSAVKRRRLQWSQNLLPIGEMNPMTPLAPGSLIDFRWTLTNPIL